MPSENQYLEARRPRPDALSRGEVARALDEPYDRIYFWTARRDPPVVTPSYGASTHKGDPDWFSPADLERLRVFLTALNTVQRFTQKRGPRRGRDRIPPK